MGVNGCRELCGVHSWKNGMRCRDGVKVLWCHSHLVWQVFESSIPTCACFVQKTFLGLIFVVLFFFFFFFLGMTREKRGGKGGQVEDAWSVKYRILLSVKTKVVVNSNAFEWNRKTNHQIYLYASRNCCPCKLNDCLYIHKFHLQQP